MKSDSKTAEMSKVVGFCRKVFLDKICKMSYDNGKLKLNQRNFFMIFMILKILLFVLIFVFVKNLIIKIFSKKIMKEIQK